MIIRPAQRSDAQAAARLLYAISPGFSCFLMGTEGEDETLAALARFFQSEGNRLSYQHALIAEVEGQVAGVLVLYHGRDAERIDLPLLERLRRLRNDATLSLTQEADADEFYIDSLSVLPEMAGQGVGTALLQAAEEHVRRLHGDKIALNVDPGNQRALRLYERLGYRTDKRLQLGPVLYHHQVKSLSPL